MTAVERVVLVALAGVALAGGHAHAQSAAAEALFQEGRALIKQGKLQAGCDKLEASEKLESSVGTLLNLGDCREKLGKPASAWAAFRKAEALAKRGGNDKLREQEARRRAAKLEPDLARITVQVGPSSKRIGLVIKRNGEVVDPALWGEAIVVDPGEHVLVAEAPGHEPWRSEVSIGKGGRRWVVVPSLELIAEPAKPAPPTAVTPPAPAPERVAEPVPAPSTTPRAEIVQPTWSAARGIAVGLAVLGAGAIGTGIYFGDRANDLEDRSDAICPTRVCDDPEGLRLNDRAQDNALRANVLFAAGGAAVAIGAVMWLVGKPDETTVITPAISDTHVGASLTGRF